MICSGCAISQHSSNSKLWSLEVWDCNLESKYEAYRIGGRESAYCKEYYYDNFCASSSSNLARFDWDDRCRFMQGIHWGYIGIMEKNMETAI